MRSDMSGARAAADIGPINIVLIAVVIVGVLVLVVGLVMLLAFDGKGVAWFTIAIGAFLLVLAGAVWSVQLYRRYKNKEQSKGENMPLVQGVSQGESVAPMPTV